MIRLIRPRLSFTLHQCRLNSTKSTFDIPFDPKPFPFTRFEPCCPVVEEVKESNDANHNEPAAVRNGYKPCKHHPIPNVLGRKIDMTEPMTRPPSLRHIVGCVGPDAIEWTRSKVEAIPGGIIQEVMLLQNDWLKSDRPDVKEDKLVLATIADRSPSTVNTTTTNSTDLLFFPEFRVMPSLEPSSSAAPLRSNTILYDILHSMWKNPNNSLPHQDQLREIKAKTVILVCTHARRDLRCGKIGPLIIEEFRKVLKEKGLQDQVEVWGTSHFGGHKFAGNLIIHQKGLGGHMYGNVRQCHVADIVDRHIIHEKVIKELWRGQITPPSI